MYEYDPDAVPQGPLETARVLGGVVLRLALGDADQEGALLVGPPGLPRLRIANPTLEFALLFDPDSIVPDVEGMITADSATLGGLSLGDLSFEFASAPAPGEPFLSGTATLRSSSLDPAGVLTLSPLNGEGGIGVDIELLAAGKGQLPSFNVEIDPAQITLDSPVLGGSLIARLHGVEGLEDRFGFSSVDPWPGVVVEFEGAIDFVDPNSDPDNPVTVLRLELPSQTGTLSGVGLQSWALAVDIEVDATATLFPERGPPLEQSFAVVGGSARLVIDSSGGLDLELAGPGLDFPDHFRLGGGTLRLVREQGGAVVVRLVGPQLTVFPGAAFENDTISLGAGIVEIDSSGRFVYDSGAQTIDLPGTFGATGQLQFGYLPSGAADGDLFLPVTTFDFGRVRVGARGRIDVEVRNRGGRSVAGAATSSSPRHFHVTPSRFHLAAGESRIVSVQFVPEEVGTIEGHVLFSGVDRSDLVSLSGTGFASGDFVQNRDRIDFGAVTRGRLRREELVLTSVGRGPLEVLEIVPPAGFRVTVDGVEPTTPFTVDSLETRVLDIVAEPTAVGVLAGELVVQTDAGTRVVSLRASGSTPEWFVSFADIFELRDGYVLASDAWFVGDGGLLVDTHDGGRTWRRRRLPGDPDLGCVAFDDRGLRGWAVGEDGTLFVTLNAGGTFSPVTGPVLSGRRFRDVAVHFQNPRAPSLATLVGDGGVIVREVAPGSLRQVSSGTPADLHAVAFHGPEGIAVGDAGTMLRSRDGAASWTPVALPGGRGAGGTVADLRSVAIASDGRFLVAGRRGYLLTGDLGEAELRLTVVTDPLLEGVDLEAVAMAGATAWVAGERPAGEPPGLVVARTTDGGVTWQEDRLLGDTGFVGTPRVLGVFGTTESHALLAEASGKILARVPHGSERILTISPAELSFGPLPAAGTQRRVVTVENRGTELLTITTARIAGGGNFSVSPVRAVTIVAGGRAFFEITYTPSAAGSDEATLVFDSDDSSGTTQQIGLFGSAFVPAWEEFAGVGQTGALASLSFPDDNLGWALGDTGLSRTIDGGTGWDPVDLPGVEPHSGVVAFAGTQDGWVLGDAGAVHRTTDGGRSWSRLGSPSSADFRDLAMLDFRSGLAIARVSSTGREMWRTERAGIDWSPASLPLATRGFVGEVIDVSPDGIFMTFSGSEVFASADLGASWTQVLNASGERLLHLSVGGQRRDWRVAICGTRGYYATRTGTEPWVERPFPDLSLDLRHVHVLDAERAWVIAVEPVLGEYSIWETGDAGVSWGAGFTAPEGAALATIDARGVDLVWAAGSRDEAPKVWRFSAGAPRGQALASAAYEVDCGEVPEGGVVTRIVSVENPGDRVIKIDNVVLEGDAFSLVGDLPSSIPAAGRAELTVEMRAGRGALLDGGTVLGALRLFTDGDLREVGVRLCGRVRADPDLLIITTEPPGLEVNIRGTTYLTPTVLHDVRPGDVVALAASARQVDPASLVPDGFTFLGTNADSGLREYVHDLTGIEFVLLPGGNFEMGSPEDEPNHERGEGPVHTVTLSPFLIGKYEVTQAQYQAVTGSNPSVFRSGPQHPVELIRWNDLKADDGFLARTGLSLPSEAQWEYAARGGTRTVFSYGDDCNQRNCTRCSPADDFMWHCGNRSFAHQPVGQKRPNPFGLFDVHGNVYELCEDVWNFNFYGTPEAAGPDPVFVGEGLHVIRGGSWGGDAANCRSADRFLPPASRRSGIIGFRPVMPLPSVEIVGVYDWVSRSDGRGIAADLVFGGGIRRLDVAYAPTDSGDTAAVGPCDLEDTSQLQGGAFLRICDASLSVPVLGGLDVSGELLLSATRIHALLQSGELSLPQVDGALGDRGSFFEASAASFSFDYEGDGQGGLTRLEVRAENPSVSVFGKGVTPESRATFSYGADGALTGSVSITGALRLLPGVFELTSRAGSSTMDLEFSESSLSFDARVRALRFDGEWAVERDVSFAVSIGNFEFGIPGSRLPDPLLDIGAFELRVGDPEDPAVNAVFLARQDGVLSVGLRQVQAELLGTPLLTITEAIADSTGVLRFDAGVNGETFTAGPVSMTTPGGDLEVHWNVLTGAFVVTIPAFTVSVTDVEWNAPTLEFPGLVLRSEDAFESSVRFGLAGIELAGIDLGAAKTGTESANYVELRFDDQGIPHVEVRASLLFFSNTFELSVDAAGDGDAKMSMQSSSVVSLQPIHDVCPVVVCLCVPTSLEAATTLDYDPSDHDWPFRGEFTTTVEVCSREIEFSIGLAFGPGGGRICWNTICACGPPLSLCFEE